MLARRARPTDPAAVPHGDTLAELSRTRGGRVPQLNGRGVVGAHFLVASCHPPVVLFIHTHSMYHVATRAKGVSWGRAAVQPRGRQLHCMNGTPQPVFVHGYCIAFSPKESRAGRTHRTQRSPCVAHTSRLHRISQRPARRHACGPHVDEEFEPTGTINGSLLLAWRLRSCPCRLLTATQWTTTRAVCDRATGAARGCSAGGGAGHNCTSHTDVCMYIKYCTANVVGGRREERASSASWTQLSSEA